jgi:hypothetical protein
MPTTIFSILLLNFYHASFAGELLRVPMTRRD